MCDCFHLVLPNWQGSPASGSGRQLRPAEPPGDADADADAEEEDSVNEVAVEDIRPRPQGSSPVYEYPVEEDYLKLQEENKKHSTDKSKQSHLQETMEVTLKTEVDAGASGFSVKGGGNEGIFIKKVLKESPASKIFSLREGDQLLSATIFFDNIKYEDALKILQYSEPYRVQFSLKRKIAVQEDLETSTAQHKKERIGQEKELSESIPEETLQVSGKSISEEDKETLIVSQRVGRSKRPKKDRLSWPKFQSIKNKKILRHRRSHSTSDAYEPALQDISPTSTDTESQFPQEVHTKEKKGSQRKLKFPSIGFRMHRSKPEPQEKQKKEIKTTLISEREKIHQYEVSLENPEILTVEYTTSPAYEIKTGEGHETLTKDLKEIKNGIPSHVKQCPEVEISIKKDKEDTSKCSVPEVPDITTEMTKPSLENADLKASPTEKSPQASSKSRKKKQKGTADKKDGESGINIGLMGHSTKGSVQVKGLEIGTAKAELQTSETLQTGEKQTEEDTQIINIQKINYGISVPKRKETEADTTKQGSDVPQSVPEKIADMTSEDSRNFSVETRMPDAESDVSTWKIQMPSFKVAKAPKTDMKIKRQESKENTEDRVKKERMEEDGIPTNDKALNIEIGMKRGEKDIEGKESKFRLPKLKFPTFTWSNTKEETAQPEAQISDSEVKMQSLETPGEPRVSGAPPEITVPSAETETEISISNIEENNKKQKPEGQMASPKKTIIKTSTMKLKTEDTIGKMWLSKKDEIEKREFIKLSTDEISENTPPHIKAPKVDISLPSVDVTLPQASVDLQAPEATISLEGEAKVPEKEAAKTKDGKFKMPKFGMPSFGWSSSSREAKGTVAAEVDVSLPEAQVTVPSGATEAEVSLPKAEVSLPEGQEGEVALQGPEAEASLEVAAGKAEGGGMKIHMPKVKVPSVVFSKPTIKSPKPSLKMPKAEIKAPKVDISLPSVDVTLPQASVDLQAPEATISLEGEAKVPEKEAAKTKDGKFKMPKFGMPSFGWSSSSREAKGTVAAEVDVSLPEAQVTVPSGATEAEVTLPGADIQAPGVEVSLPKAEVSLRKGQEGEVALQGPEAEASLEVAAGKAEGGGMKIHMPKVKVPSVVFSKPTIKSPKPSLKMPKAEIKAPKVDISLPSVDVTLPQASVDLQAPEATISLEGEAKVPEKEAAKTKDGKFKMPKFGMPSFGWSSSSREAKGTVAAEVDVSLPEAQVTVPSGATEAEVTLPGADIQAPGVEVSLPKAEVSLPKGQEGEVALQGPEAEASLEVAAGKAEGGGMKIHMPKVKVPSVVFSKPTIKSPKPSLKMPKAEIKAPKVDISLPSVDVTLPQASVDLQAPEATISLEGEAKVPEKEAAKTKDGKFKMPKFGMPSFGWSSSSREAKGTVAAEVDVSLPEAQVTVPSGATEAEVTLPGADIQAPGVEVSLPKAEVSLPKGQEGEVALQGPEAEASLEVAAGKAEGGGMKIHMPKVKVPSVVFSKPTIKSPKPSLKMPKAEIKAPKVDISLPSVDVTLPQASVDLQAPEATISLEGEAKVPEKEAAKTKDGKFKMPKFGMPSFGWSSSSREAKGTVAAEVDVSLPEAQVTVPSGATEAEVTLPGADIQAPGVEVSLPKAEVSLPEGQEGEVALQGPEAEASLEVAAGKAEGGGMKIHMPKVKVPSVVFSKPTIKSPKPSLKMPKAEIKAPKVDISLPSVDVTLPQASVDLQAPEATISLEGEAKVPEKEAAKTKDGKFKMPKFGMPSFGWSSSSREAKGTVAAEVDVSLPEAQVTVPSGATEAEVTLPGADIQAPGVEVSLPKAEVSLPKGQEGEVALQGPEAEASLEVAAGKAEGGGMKIHMPKVKVPSVVFSKPTIKSPKPSLKMPKAEIKAPKVDISLPSVDVTLPQASVDLQAPEATISLEGEAKVPEKEAAKTKDGKFKMPKFGMPSFGWSSSSREAKGTVAAEVDVSLPEAQVTVPSGATEAEVTLPGADIQAPGVEVSLPKAEVSLPEGQEGEVALQGPEAEASLEVAAGKAEGGGMKIHMPKVKVPSVVFSKPTIKSPKPSLKMPKAEIKAPKVDISLPSVDVTLPQASVDLQAPEATISLEGEAKVPEKEAAKTKDGKFKMPKFGMPSFGWSSSSREAKGTVAAEVDVSLPEAQVTVPSGATEAEVTLPGADIQAPGVEVSLPKAEVSLPKGQEGEVALQGPEAEASLEVAAGKAEGGGMKIHMPKVKVPSVVFSKPTIKSPKPSLKMPKAEIKAPKVDISLPSVDVTLPQASVDLQAPEATISLEGEAKVPEKEAAKTKDGKFKMPKFGMPSFGWSSSSREAKGTVAAEVDVSLPEAQVTVPSGATEAEVTLPGADIQAPGVEVSPPKADVSLPKGQEGEVALQGPEAEASLEVAAGKAEGGGMKIHMPKVKVPSVVFSKPTIKSPKPSLKMPKAEIKAPKVDISLPSVDVTLPQASVDLQAPEATISLEGEAKVPEKEAAKTKDGKFKMPKFGMPSFGWSSSSREAKGTVAAEVDVSLPEAQVTVPSGATEAEVTLPGADIQAPGVEVSLPKAEVSLPEGQEGEVALQGPEAEASLEVAAGKAEGGGMKIHMPKVKVPSVVFSKPTIKSPKPSLKMPKAEIKAPKVDISLPSVDVTLPQASVDLQAPEATISLEGEAKVPEKEAAKTKDGKFKMPKFGMPSFGWSSSSREAKGTVAAEVDVSLPEAQVTVPSGATEAEVTLPGADIQAPGVEVSLPKAEVSLPKGQEGEVALQGPEAEASLEVAAGKAEGGGMKIHMPKVKVPSVVFSKPTIKSPKPSLKMPKAEIKAPKVDISLPSVDVTLPQASVDLQAPEATISLEGEAKVPEKEAAKTKDGKFKMPKFGMPSFGWSSSSREAKGTVAAEVDVSLPEAQVTVPSGATEAEVTLPGADIQAPGVEVSPPKADVSLPKGQEGEVALQGPEAEASLEVAAGKAEGGGMKIHMPKVKVPSVVFSKPTIKSPKPSLKMPKAEIKAPKVDISLPSVDVTLPQASVDLQAPEATISLEGEAKVPEKEAAKTKDGKFKMPKFGMPSFGWSSSSREAKGTVAAEVDVSLPEAQVTVPSGATEAEVTLPGADIQAPGVEVSLPKAEVSLPKGQEGEVALQGPEAEASLEVAAGKAEGGGMKIHMPKVKVPSVVFSKPTIKSPKPSLKMPKAEIKAPKVDISLPSVDVTLPQASVDLQAPEATISLEGEAKVPEKEAAKTKDGKFKMPKFGMPSFGWSSSSREAKGTVAAEVDVSLPEAQVTVPSGATKAEVTLPGADIQAPGVEVSLPKAEVSLPKGQEGEVALQGPEAEASLEVAAGKAEGGGMKIHMPKVKVPSVVFSKPTIKSPKPSLKMPKAEIKAPKVDISLPSVDITLPQASVDLQAPEATISLEGEAKVPEKEAAKTKDGKFKMPKFGMPSFGWSSSSREAKGTVAAEVDVSLPEAQVTAEAPTAEVSLPSAEVELPSATVTAAAEGSGVKLEKPSLKMPKAEIKAPKVDISLPSVDVTLPNLEAEIHGPDLECKAEQEVVTGEKGAEEKENKFKASKFKLPSFRWSPKKEAIAPSHVEDHLEGPTLSTLSGDMGAELTLPTPENQYLHEEFDTTEKDGEKAKTKKSQFTMPKISFPKIKGQKVQVSLPVLETDFSGPKQEKEGASVQKSDKGGGEIAGLGIKVPKVTVPTSEFSKPEAKAPKVEMHISMPTGEVKVPTCEGDDLTLKSAAANASLSTSDIKMIPEGLLEVKSPEISVERKSSEVAVGDIEIKAEGSEGKTKMSKFQMPKVGITLSKGKGLEKDVGQSKSEVKVPQLKATVEISDIAVEAPDLKVEYGTETRVYSPEAKITKTDSKTSEADVDLPSADIPFPKTDSDIQDSDAAVKIKGEIKQDGDGEEKEGHFKMPKFKLPSFSWSPKKEASVKSDSGANLEDQKLAVMSSRIDTEVKETATGSGADLDLEIAAGKVEQKSPIKKPQFVMPKISLSKIKVPKSQKVEADATLPKTEIEGDDSIKIPDIEKSHPEGTEEGAQISIKLADTTVHTLEFSSIETEASKTEITVSSAKIDASLTPSEGSFQQVDLKISSTNECNIQKTGTKLPKGEASVDLKSPDILTESSSVVDGRKVKLEGAEGKIKMPKFQKTKFGISRVKGKVPEPEISSPKIEAELPQLRTTNKIADIAVGVPASELVSDLSDPVGIDGKIKTPQALTGGIEDANIDISTQSVSKPKIEGVSESLEEKESKLKEHEIKAEEVQTEEHQGWFKMPKFRIPAFGRSSLKEQKSDADSERSMEKAQATIPSAKVQTETSVPENAFSLPHAVAEITVGKEEIQKLGDSVKTSNVSSPKIEGHISLSAERTDSRVSLPKTETYADVFKRSAEGHTSEITVSAAELSKSYPSASETEKDRSSTNRFPMCTLTSPEHKGKSQDINVQKVESSMKLETSGVGCEPSSAEITLDATQKKIDINLPKEELDIRNKEAAIKKGKIKGEVKITGKDSEESQLKWTMCEWSTTEGSEDGTYVTAKLEDLKVEVPTLKTDVKITGVDPEMKFCVKSVEKDVSAGVEVQVEDRAETSKIKAYKFKIPRFGMLHSEIKGFEDDTNLPKSEADSAPRSERDTAEMQLQKPEGLIDLKSPGLDRIEASARVTGETVDQTQGFPEVSVRIPKLKIPRFTFRTSPIEADVLLSKVVTDPKGSSTDIEIVQLQASSAIPEETQGAVEGGIQKAKSKILTLTEPDIKTAQMTATIESSLSSAGQDIHWSYIEGQEVREKVEPEHVAIERCEIYTTEILKESEILSSEVKTATLGFSLLKAKLPESRSDLDVLVQQTSPTGDASVRKPAGAGESFGVAAQRTGSAELKLSDKPHHGSEESRGKVSLSKLKASAAEVKGSSKLEETFPGKSPEGITAAPLSEDEDVVEAVEGEEKDITNEKEKTDSKRSPGRFKFWLPSIGFSSSGDETSTDAKAEIKKSVPEDVKPADTSDDSSKQAEKAGWFRFPKLGFTSPSKKAKSVDKEEVGHKEGRISDEDSPTDKPDVFFDAQESLSPKETAEGEKAETDGASSIVTSSARTELILLEEEKDSKSSIVGDTGK
ncbi:unnamed protein product [Coccothraustes coccothraustes]